MKAQETLTALLRRNFETVLDIGSGDGCYAKALADAGKRVTTINLQPPADHVGDYLKSDLGKFDCLWVCHVLEHQRNPGAFLDKCHADLKWGGWLAVTVPPRKDEIVGGHVTLWNAGILLYQLVLAGFNCRDASIKSYGYNVSVIVQKRPMYLPLLKQDFGDLDTLSHLLPDGFHHGINGCIKELNW